MSACPPLHVLEDAAAGKGSRDGEFSDHLPRCSTCRRTLEDIRLNNTLLTEITAVRRTSRTHRERPLVLPSVDDYEILECVAQGGQGVVYRAIQKKTKRRVALKLLIGGHFATPRQRSRFEREIELIAGLRHPNIVTIFDSGATADGRLYYAMEYVDGVPLDEYFGTTEQTNREHAIVGPNSARKALTIDETLRLFCKICEAVNYAHQRGIVHRDLKPGNILVDSKSEPRILDFGLAKVSGIEALPGYTVSVAGEFMGTFAYASPEQAAGNHDLIDIRTDVYSLGIILYELFTCRHPYPSGGSVAEAIRNITETEPESPSTVNAKIDDELDTIALKAMAKEPSRRYQSAGELLADIQRYRAGEAIDAKRDSTWYVLRKSVRRHRAAVLFASIVIVGLVTFSIFMSLAYRRASRAEQAEAQRSGELADSLHASNIERGRLMVYNGNVTVGERLLWREYLVNTPDSLCSRQALWALRELYSQQPCLATLATGSPDRKRPHLRFLDSQTMAMYGAGSIETWNLPTLTRTAEQNAPGLEPVLGIGNPVSEDGRSVAMGRGNQVFIWDRLSNRPPCPMEVTTTSGSFGACTLSADGRCCGVADAGGHVQFCDAATGKLLAAYKNNPCSVTLPGRVFLTPNGLGLVTIGADNQMAYWDLAQPGNGPRWSFVDRLLNTPKWSNTVSFDQRLLAVTESDSTILLVDLASGRSLAKLNNGVDDIVTVMTPNSNSARLASSGRAKTIRIWNIQLLTCEKELLGNDTPVNSLQFNTNGNILCSVNRGGVTKLWDASPKSPVSLGKHESTVMAVRFTADGRELVCSDGTGRIQSYDLPSGEPVRSLLGHTGPVSGIALSPNGTQLASVGYDGTLRLWDRVASCSVANLSLSAHDELCDVSWSPDGRMVAAASQDRVIYLLAPDNQTPPRELRGHTREVATVAFSPDGRTLASGDRDGQLFLWNVANNSIRFKLRADATTVHAVAFSPVGPTLISGGSDRAIRIWNGESGRCMRTLEGHQHDVFALCVSPDGRMIASGDSSGVIILWDVESGRELIKIRRHTDMVFTLAFSPDGRQLASGSRDRTLQLHDLSYFDRHIAGNMEYQIANVGEQGLDPGLLANRRRWAIDLWQSRWESSSEKNAKLETKLTAPNDGIAK